MRYNSDMTDGIVLIDKPAGMTSFGVVARIRRVLSRDAGKKVKVGHTGTLDPFATGLMILVVGKECREAGRYTKLDKVYTATIRLGGVSTTGDPEGEISAYCRRDLPPPAWERLHAASQSKYASSETRVADVPDQEAAPAPMLAQPQQAVLEQDEASQPTLAQIQEVARQFTGEIRQRPPVFSAIKIDGQRAYKLARDGKEVEMPERTVTVYSLDILEYAYPELKIRTHVSSGTYIRSLAVDMGEALGTGAYCSELRRESIAEWSVHDAKTLNDFNITS